MIKFTKYKDGRSILLHIGYGPIGSEVEVI